MGLGSRLEMLSSQSRPAKFSFRKDERSCTHVRRSSRSQNFEKGDIILDLHRDESNRILVKNVCVCGCVCVQNALNVFTTVPQFQNMVSVIETRSYHCHLYIFLINHYHSGIVMDQFSSVSGGYPS